MTNRGVKYGKISNILGIIGAFIIILGIYSSKLFWIVGAIVFIFAIYIEYKFVRCPVCDKSLRNFKYGKTHCPYCGTSLSCDHDNKIK